MEYNKINSLTLISCRDDWIRTSGLFVPNEARYRAALHPEIELHLQINKNCE